MTTLALGFQCTQHTRTRVDHLRFLNDQAIFDQFPNILSCIAHREGRGGEGRGGEEREEREGRRGKKGGEG